MYAESVRLAAELGGHYMDQFTYAERATDWRSNNNIAESIFAQVRANIDGIAELLGKDPETIRRGTSVEIDDQFFGEGYGIPTPGSREAIELAARTEALFLDPTYTGKAMAGLIAYVRQQRFTEKQTVVFWHTGGQVGLFA